MKGNALTKVGRLADYFVGHPSELPRYLRSARAFPLKLGKPWISWPAIDFLAGHDRKDMDVFEYGSGGSTLFFAERARSVKSVEHDASWYDFQQKGWNAPESRVVLQAVDVTSDNATPVLDYVNGIDGDYDIILVDGLDDVAVSSLRPLRVKCFEKARSHVRAGGIIVVDDAWRYDDIAFDVGEPQDVRRFQGPGPGRWGITRTDVYFY